MENKRKLITYVVIVLAIILFSSLFFTKVLKKSVVSISKDTEESSYQNWKTYSNSRFSFSVKYPSYWPAKDEATNGDGKALYKDNFGNEILAYASNVPTNFLKRDNLLDHGNVDLNDGREATYLKYKENNGKMVYIMFFNQNNLQEGKQYVLYAKANERFFKENEEILKTVSKSFIVD